VKEFKAEIFHLDPSELTPYANNSKKHTTEQIDEIAGQISKFGFDQPIVVDRSRVIIKGHGRREAAIRLRLKSVPVIIQDLSEYEAMAARIADNKVASKTGFDMDKLAFDIGTLERNKFDLKSTGFDEAEIKKMIEEIPEHIRDGGKVSGNSEPEPQPVTVVGPADEEVPEVKKTSLRIGSVIELGRHILVCGDSTDAEFVKRHCHEPDLVYTDPPYGINEKTDRSFAARSREAKGGVFAPIIGDESIETAVKAIAVIKELKPKATVIWGANYFCHHLPQTAQWLVWDKRVEENQRDMNSDCELAWVDSGKKSVRIFRHLWKGMIKGSEHGEARVHPTQKPIALAEWSIAEYAPDSRLVVDLFAGSGSTLLACERLGKVCVAFELSPEYCEAICLRWEKLTDEKRKIVSL
jgi:DNA modification methylase